MSRAASLITPRAAARAAAYYDAHPDAYAYAVDYCQQVAGRIEYNADDAADVAAVAAAIVPAFVREGREEDRTAIRAAVRRAVKRASVAVTDDKDEATPYDIDRDETRTVLTTYAPDPAAAYAVRPIDYVAQALMHIESDTRRETMRRAAVDMRHGAPTLTTASTPRGQREQVSQARKELGDLRGRILADPYGDGTGNRTKQHHPDHTYDRPRQRVAKSDRPAQVPAWTFQGGTARPQIGACVSARLIDTGTPGTEVTRITVTRPDGTPWSTTHTDQEWTAEDTRRLSQALAQDAATEPLTHVERFLSAPRYGTPKAPSKRGSRVGNTGPTVPAYGMTR